MKPEELLLGVRGEVEAALRCVQDPHARNHLEGAKTMLEKADETISKWADGQRGFHELFHDSVVVMQAAWIEWRHGKGAEQGMVWIENRLDGPGMIPDPEEPYVDDAQRYYDLNKSRPLPPCAICEIPSHIGWMGKGFCSREHCDEYKAAHPDG